MTSGHIVSALNLSLGDYSSRELHVFYDGKKLVMHCGDSTVVATSLEVVGPKMPFSASFRLTHGTHYRKDSTRPIFSHYGQSIALHADAPLGGSNTSLNHRPLVDFGTVYKAAYELRVPYKHLRSFVKKNKSVICFFTPDGFGFYNQKHEPILFPKMNLVRYHVNHDEPQVIFITEKDVLKHLTRAQCRGSEHVFIGVGRFPSGSNSRLKRVIGREGETFWSRTDIGPTNKALYQVGPNAYTLDAIPDGFRVIANTQRYTPNYGDLSAGDWTIPVEEQEMTDEQKETVRAWWRAFIAQKTRMGEEISPEHQQVADDLLS